MDDVAVGGVSSLVLSNRERVQVCGAGLGLTLIVKKCELIHQPGVIQNAYFRDFIHLEPNKALSLTPPYFKVVPWMKLLGTIVTSSLVPSLVQGVI